ncbi:hypothetical protein E2C01_091751 [Portunus trituberculatus]|uniref:Uncharacterized protein n=1 Tax=Portunus trituberculatus TaxID=210409 RepID=A0A5B7JNS8_PORTR|nr:hypothetical protein [Portunus trituberculatus]
MDQQASWRMQDCAGPCRHSKHEAALLLLRCCLAKVSSELELSRVSRLTRHTEHLQTTKSLVRQRQVLRGFTHEAHHSVTTTVSLHS